MTAAPLLQPVLRAGEQALVAAGIETAKLDAELLLGHVLGMARLDLYRHFDRALTSEVNAVFQELIARRAGHEPVAYITGRQEFWGLDFTVNSHTLIPRQDTETLVEVVLKRRRGQAPKSLLDLGAGSGCISLSLAHEIPGLHVICADISEGALAAIGESAVRLGLSERVTCVQADWFKGITAPDGGFDIIVSNPPYIPSADIAGLMPDVRDHEPCLALDGGPDGLAPYRIIAAGAPARLGPGGLLAFEVGIGQAADVAAILAAAGFGNIETARDLPGIDRVVSGQKS